MPDAMTDALTEFWRDRRVVALSGGVGGAKLVHGLARVLPPDVLRVIVNTGDDFEWMSCWISPDLDTLMYTLSERAPIARGWGIEGDSFEVMQGLKDLGGPDWFSIGDQDLAVHLMRTHKLRQGETLTKITQDLLRAHALRTPLLPMSDTPQATIIEDQDGVRHSFQDWLVQLRAKPVVQRIHFEGDGQASDAVLQEIASADLVLLPPSNPFVSIDPILRLQGVRDALRNKVVVGVSPILGGAAVKGPLAEMIPPLLQEDASASALARYYADFLNLYVVSPGDLDADLAVPQVEADILMQDISARDRVAHEVLTQIQQRNILAPQDAS